MVVVCVGVWVAVMVVWVSDGDGVWVVVYVSDDVGVRGCVGVSYGGYSDGFLERERNRILFFFFFFE